MDVDQKLHDMVQDVQETLPQTIQGANAYLESLYVLLAETRSEYVGTRSMLTAAQACLDQDDPEILVLKQDDRNLQYRYSALRHQHIPRAKEHLEQLQRQTVIDEREAWIRETHPDLIREINELAIMLRTLPSDSRQHYVAKTELSQMRWRAERLWQNRQKEIV